MEQSERVGISLMCGIVLPISYIAILVLALPILGDKWQPVLSVPVGWPGLIYFYFYPSGPDPNFPMFADFAIGNLIFIAVGNFMLYSVLAYVFLYWRSHRRARPTH